jgi:hypothetical protein
MDRCFAGTVGRFLWRYVGVVLVGTVSPSMLVFFGVGGEPSLDGAGRRVLPTHVESVQLPPTALDGLWVAEGVLWATQAIPM